jgi:hypothetical protein
MNRDQAQKIHDLMEELSEIERFLRYLRKDGISPEVWLRKIDGSVAGMASDCSGDYRIGDLKEMLINYYDMRKGAIADEIAGM